jgi:hypothetical protein
MVVQRKRGDGVNSLAKLNFIHFTIYVCTYIHILLFMEVCCGITLGKQRLFTLRLVTPHGY